MATSKQRNGSAGETNLTVNRAYEMALSHLSQGLVQNPLSIEANWVALRAATAVRESTGLAKAVKAWQQRTRGRKSNRSQIQVNDSRFLLLRALYFASDRRLFMTEISAALNITMTYVTKLVDGLVSDELVERHDDPLDKRKTFAALTPEGLDLVEELLPPVARQIEQNWKVLTESETRTLIHLLTKVLESLGAEHDIVIERGLE